MNPTPDSTPVAAPKGSEHLIEEWECRACHPDFPCLVQIHFAPAFTDEAGHRVRFFRRECVAGEPLVPEWRMNPIRSVSPNTP